MAALSTTVPARTANADDETQLFWHPDDLPIADESSYEPVDPLESGKEAVDAVSRRPGAPWAPTSVPWIRRSWCDALFAVIQKHSTALIAEPGELLGDNLKVRRMQAKLADTIEIMKAETEALSEADLYWVARDMVDVAVDAASTLPEWTPALAAPCPNGLLCWAKPAGLVPYGPTDTATADVAWDGVWWWTRPDGRLQVTPASRFVKQPEVIAPFEVSTPLWASHTILVDPGQPRTEEAHGAEDMHPFLSIVGAAWLLMGQPGITESRAIEDRASSRPPRGLGRPPNLRTTPRVTIVELRRPVRLPHEATDDASGRRFNRRWWVGGHWRQQACGPSLAQRRPTWIAPYVKGPPAAPLVTDRVYLWRR